MFSDFVAVLEISPIYDSYPFIERLFRVILPSMYRVRPFRLVFCLKIWDHHREEAVETLKGYIDAEVAAGGLRFLHCPPVIVSNNRASEFQVREAMDV